MSPKKSLIIGLLVVAWVLFGRNSLDLFSRLHRVAEMHGVTLAEVCAFEDPGFQTGFRDSVNGLASPGRLFRDSGPFAWLILLAAPVAIILGWRSATQTPAVLAAAIPFVIGLAAMPHSVLQSLRVLSANSVSMPEAYGMGWGIALYPGVLGAVVGLLCLVSVLLSRRSDKPVEIEDDGIGADS